MPSSNPRWWLTPSAIFRYGVAVLSITAALIIAWWMEFAWQSAAHASLFLCAVMFSAWFGGIKPGLLAIALSVLAFDYYFLAMEIKQLPRLLMFALSAFFVALLSAAQRRQQNRSETRAMTYTEQFESSRESTRRYKSRTASASGPRMPFGRATPTWRKRRN
jgi:K+-sensing histidine kinase KdpD